MGAKKARRKLTNHFVRSVGHSGKGTAPEYHGDTDVPGLYLRVNPPGPRSRGARSFTLRYRLDGASGMRNYGLGRLGSITLTQARALAREKLVLVQRGIDPVAERRRRRREREAAKTETLGAFATEWLEDHAKQNRKSWREDERRINTHLKDGPLWRRAAREVSVTDLRRLHRELSKSTGPVEANRVIEVVRACFNKAVQWGKLPAGYPNPTKGVDLNPEKDRARYLSEEEAKRLWEAVSKEPSPYVRAYHQLLLLLGLRRRELLSRRWEDIQDGRLRVDDTKSGEPQLVPLSTHARMILAELPREQGNPFIFPSPVKAGRHVVNWNREWRRIRKRAGLENVHLHDLRRTVGSWLALSGESLPRIGNVLGHADSRSTAIYARLSVDAAAESLENHGQHVARVVGLGDDGSEALRKQLTAWLAEATLPELEALTEAAEALALRRRVKVV